MQVPLVLTGIFPGSGICKVFVVAFGFTFFGLHLFPEMPAATFIAMQGIDTHQFAKFDKVSNPVGFIQLVIEFIDLTGDPYISSRILFSIAGSLRSLHSSPFALRAMPHLSHMIFPRLLWKLSTLCVPFMFISLLILSPTSFSAASKAGCVMGIARCTDLICKVIAKCIRDHKISIGQALHQRGGAKAIGAMI